jgi:hypothetical protein
MVGAGGTDELKCEGSDFDGAIVDDGNLLNYLENNNAKSMPSLVKDKYELRNRLAERGLSEEYIDYLLL